MKKLTSKYRHRRIIIVVIVIVVFFLSAYVYRDIKRGLFVRSDYEALKDNLTKQSTEFKSNDDLASYITDWADSINLKYHKDSHDNIIFTSKSTKSKSHVDDVTVCLSYNYKNIENNIDLIAAAQYIAASKIKSTTYNVILFNNDNGSFDGYTNVSKKYFPNDTKVIYLDSGKKTYASMSSFNEETATYAIDNSKEAATCDSLVHLKISGVKTDEITNRISSQPNPITAFGTILSYLESKASHYELANIDVTNEGNMFPSSIEVDIMVNSYSVESLTKQLDKKSEAFIKKYKEDFPDVEYSYEIIEDESMFPETCYSPLVCKSINNIIYTFNNGTYRFDEEDNIPADYKEGNLYGINSIEQIRETDEHIYIDVCTQALTDAYLSLITEENKTIADFADCKYIERNKHGNYYNNDASLYNELNFTYLKVNDLISKNIIIKEKEDFYFTPCSIIQKLNPKTDIIHLSVSEDSIGLITNTILYYIESLGNFLSL